MTNDLEFLEALRLEWEARAGAGQHSAPRVNLDWAEYFRRFCAKHGGPACPPLMWRGKLLFADGWAYALAHEGPEWPPPDDPAELRKLRQMYWRLRRHAVRRELVRAEAAADELDRLVGARDLVPVEAVSRVTGEGDGARAVTEHREVDPEAARMRVGWLREDLVICEFKVADPDWEPGVGVPDARGAAR